MKELLVDPAAEKALPKVLAFVEKELSGRDVSLKALNQILIAVEEIFVNIARHAYPPDEGDALIRCSVENSPPQVRIQFLDKGVPFNPMKRELPDTALPLEKREIGGLGILMVRKTMSHVDYEYKDGKNILTIRKEI